MHHFRELHVWQKAMLLAKHIYLETALFPKDEIFGLSAQIKRCAVSIPSNIAEGCGRDSDREFVRFLAISLGSAYELETQLLLSQQLNILSDAQSAPLVQMCQEVQKMLYVLIKKYKDSTSL